MPRAVVDQRISLTVNRIEPKSNSVGTEIDAHTSRFKGRAPRVVDPSIVSKYFEVTHVASRVAFRRNHAHRSTASFARKPIHIRRMGHFQRSLPPQRFEGIVRRAVGNENQVFHLQFLHANKPDSPLHRLDGGNRV